MAAADDEGIGSRWCNALKNPDETGLAVQKHALGEAGIVAASSALSRAPPRPWQASDRLAPRRSQARQAVVYNRGFVFSQAMTRSSNPAKSVAKEAKDAIAPSYEQALTELERLVSAMEGQQLPLDQLLESYQRGAELLGFCRTRLQAVEQQVKVLEGGELKTWEGS